jgi:hypothetical protein
MLLRSNWIAERVLHRWEAARAEAVQGLSRTPGGRGSGVNLVGERLEEHHRALVEWLGCTC